MKIPTFPTIFALTFIVSLATSNAGDFVEAKSPAVAYDADSDFSFEFMPYLWAAGVEGTTSIGNLSTTSELAFDDVIDNLDMSAAFVAGFKFKRLGFLTDFQYLKISPSRPTRGPVFSSAGLTLEQTSLALLGSYDVIASDRLTLSLLAGARYLNVDTTLNARAGLAPGFSRRNTTTSWDGVGGFRAKYFLCDDWFLSAYGDVGSGSSDLTWQAYAGVGYLFSESAYISVGYRVLGYETSTALSTTDQRTSGLFLGLGYAF